MDLFELIGEYYADNPMTKQEQEQNVNYLLNHPLFIKQLPENIQQNEELKALITLQQDEDPNDVAQNLNKQANKKLSESQNGLYHMKQAYQRYSQAISIKCPSPAINAKLHANRAQLNLKLKNYGKVIQDCRSCLKFDPNYVKGYYRYAKALLILQKYEQCIKFLAPRNQPQLQELLNQAKAKNKKKIEEQQKKKQKKKEKQNQIQVYCQQKGWKYLKREQPLPQGAKAQIIQNKLSIPLVVLYPQFSQFDLFTSTFEQNKIKQLLKQPIDNGLPWDFKKQYSMDSIEIYCQISEAVLMKIPKQAKIGDILTKIPFKEGLEVQVVRKNNSFYQNYIRQHKII